MNDKGSFFHVFMFFTMYEDLKCHDKLFLMDFDNVQSVVSEGLSVPLFRGL